MIPSQAEDEALRYGGPMTAILVARLRAAGCVFAEDEAALLHEAAADAAELETLVQQRIAGQPLEHVVGWVDFAGLRLRLGPGVFVPRPRSEYLVQVAASALTPGGMLVDLCSGCGAIGLAVTERIKAEVHLAELDPVAAGWARINAAGRAAVHEGDLFDALPDELRGRIDVVTVVAPYVPTDEIALMPHEARDFEPPLALDGGDDGLVVVRRIVSASSDWLAPGGQVMLEVAGHQAESTVRACVAAGLVACVDIAEDGETVVVGTKVPSPNDQPVRS
jgi:release factor glutamine methyltransferase